MNDSQSIPQVAPEERKKGNYHIPNGKTLPISQVGSVLALNSLGVSQSEIARREKISRTTVHFLVKQGDQNNPKVVERIKKSLAAHWYVTAERGLQTMTSEKLEKSSAAQLAIISSIATEKAFLADGKPTSKIEFSQGDDELSQEIKDLEIQLEQWKAGKVQNAEVESAI